ncbi:MAG: hypothetical protein IK121_03150 [Lachnospiraceae bacterium]|nr:hypothetical protein [Lachnospiraceae bacterium]
MFEIYFDDLNSEAQEAYLEFLGINDPKEANLDIVPIAVLEEFEEE